MVKVSIGRVEPEGRAFRSEPNLATVLYKGSAFHILGNDHVIAKVKFFDRKTSHANNLL